MKGAVSPITVLKSEDSAAWENTALPTEAILSENEWRARGISDHAIKVKNSVDIV